MFDSSLKIFTLCALSIVLTACPAEKNIDNENTSESKTTEASTEQISLLMNTSMGEIELVLYNETPKHRDNFVKLVKEEFYTGILFHRVMSQFMVQAGDPNSKTAEQGAQLGDGGPGYTVPAEFNTSLIHKKGALSAARQPDQFNPNKESSGSQFYIVQGQKYSASDREAMMMQTNQNKLQTEIRAYLSLPENTDKLATVQRLSQAGPDSINPYIEILKDSISYVDFKYTEEQEAIYSSIGGTPFLDANYTVFGEVTKGLDVIDKIAAVSVDGANRPTEDVKILSITIIE